MPPVGNIIPVNLRYARLMARYSVGQNERAELACDALKDRDRRKDLGAFFGSIHGTLSHLIWADRAWLSRLGGGKPLEGVNLEDSPRWCGNWTELKAARHYANLQLLAWAEKIREEDLRGDVSFFSQAAGRHLTLPTAIAVIHFFNHQTHHRGQLHAMITAAGGKGYVTDLALEDLSLAQLGLRQSNTN